MQLIFSVAILLFAASPAISEANGPKELTLERAFFAKSSHELSGLTIKEGKTYIVSDDAEEHNLYQIIYDGNRFTVRPAIEFKKLNGFDAYKASLEKFTNLEPKNRRFDLEGIAVCGGDFYLANERVRQILVVNPTAKTLKALPLDFSAVPVVFEGEANAGFEGIAADCDKKRLFLGKERSPRGILIADLATNKVQAMKDFAPSNRSGQKAINFETGDGLIQIDADIGDLFFENGFLYVLERATYEVTKIDPDTMQVVDRYSYFKTARNMYESDEPFAKAEALFLTKDGIIIGEDNNREPLSLKAEKLFKVKGDHAAVYFFKRPAGF